MGANQSQSSRVNKEEKERRKNVQNLIINKRKEELSAIENHVVSSGTNNVKEIIQATTYAKNQLERGGKPLNKGDLVAIIIALDNKRICELDKLNTLRLEDLNALIRTIIYDFNNFDNKNNLLTNNSSNINSNINNSSNINSNINSKNKKEDNNLLLVAPPLPPKKEDKSKSSVLTITNDIPSYALVRR